MHLSNRSTSVLLSFALATTMVPTVPAFAANSAEEQSSVQTQELNTSVPVVPEQEYTGFVYDKADFYVEAETPQVFADSGEEATASLQPLYLSDEMKYFAKYESGQDYDHGLSYGDGYNAMGYYQFDRRYGLRDFMLACYAYDSDTYGMFAQFESYTSRDFRDMTVREYDDASETWVFTDFGAALNASWHAAYAANPTEFAGLQDAWAYDSYYLPAENYLKGRGIDISTRADCVKGLCWGMSNLFGTGGWRKFVGGVTSGYDWDGNWQDSYDWPGAGLTNDMSDVEFVTTLCNYVVDNVAVFYKAQPEYHAGWQNRYRSELNDCLEYLKCAWVKVDGQWQYHIKGVPVTNQWYKTNQYWSYFDADGNAYRDGWKNIDGSWYLFDKSCYMVSDSWLKDDAGNWLYLRPDGAMATNQWYKTNAYWSYFDANGYAYRDGVKTINGKYYCFDKSCYLLTDAWIRGTSNEYWYYAGSSGAYTTGKAFIDNKWFFFDDEGLMYHGFKKIDGSYYDLSDKHDGSFGAMSVGWVETPDGRRYFNEDPDGNLGAMAYGWFYIGDVCLYADPKTGFQVTGWLEVDNDTFYMDPESLETTGQVGALTSGWLRFGVDEFVYLNERHDGRFGALLTDWQWVDTNWFYMNPAKGDTYGHLMYGWQKLDDTWYYFEPEHLGHFGEAAEGWDFIDGRWYYFYSNRSLAQSAWLLDGSTWYYLKSSGAMAQGWEYINGSWYLFKSWGGMAQSEWVGDYYFTASGAMATDQWVGKYYVGHDGRWVR